MAEPRAEEADGAAEVAQRRDGPGSSGTVAPPLTWTRVLAGLAFVTGGTAALLLRQSGSPSWRTVWAEDVNVFYLDALSVPLHEALLSPYAGYAHLLPRLLAAIGVEMQVSWYAPWTAGASALAASLLALFVYVASAPLLRAPLRRAVLACSTLWLPILPFELVAAVCNIQWFFALPCLLALLFPVYRWVPVAVRSIIAVLGPLSAPLAVFLAPVAIWQLVVGLRRRVPSRTLIVPVLYLLASGIQGLIFLGAASEPSAASTSQNLPLDLVKLYAARVLNDLVFGIRLTDELWEPLGWGIVVVAVLVVAGLLAWKLRAGTRRSRAWVLSLSAASALLLVAQLFPRQSHIIGMVPGEVYLYGGTRWMVLPTLLMVTALLVPPDVPSGLTVDAPGDPALPESERELPSVATDRGLVGWWQQVTAGLPWVGLVAVVTLWSAAALVPSFRLANDRSGVPTWPSQVGAARLECEIDAGTAQELDVPPDWTVELTCEQLE